MVAFGALLLFCAGLPALRLAVVGDSH